MMRLSLMALCLAGCPVKNTVNIEDNPDVEADADTDTDTDIESVDDDGDGYGADTDCDDTDSAIYPGATEYCDGIDSDCDGDATDAGLATFFPASGQAEDLTAQMGKGVNGGPVFVTLSQAGTLYIGKGTWYVSLVLRADVDVVGFHGRDQVILDGGEDATVVTVKAGSEVSLSELTLQNGYIDGNGGGIDCEDATLSIAEVGFKDNEASGYGGGLFASGCSIGIQDSDFDKNKGTGGGIYMIDSSLDIDATTFTESDGSGINMSDSSLSAYETTFTHSTGSALYIHSGATATLDECGFYTNTAGAWGGAVYAQGEDVSVQISGGTMERNTAVQGGGAIMIDAGASVALSSGASEMLITENTALKYGGGAIFAYTDASLTGTNVIFDGNSSTPQGGAILAAQAAEVVLSGGEFTNNTASTGGGLIVASDVPTTVSKVYFSGNKPSSVTSFDFGDYDYEGTTASFTCGESGCE